MKLSATRLVKKAAVARRALFSHETSEDARVAIAHSATVHTYTAIWTYLRISDTSQVCDETWLIAA